MRLLIIYFILIIHRAFIITIYCLDLLANYVQELTKLIKINQSSAMLIKDIAKRQENLEKKFDDQNVQILEILDLLKKNEEMHSELEPKGKKKLKKNDEFYQVDI
jgi:hypothetical protein